MRNYFLTFLAIFMLAACQNNSGSQELQTPELSPEMKAQQEALQQIAADNRQPSELDGTNWKLVAMTYEGEEFPLRPEPEEAISFQNWRIMGGGCKRFSGIFDVPETGQIEVSFFRKTDQRCSSSVTPQERRLHEIIENAASYELTGGSILTLTSEKGSATFAAQ
jgi:heat shock protein HslJ